MVITNKNRETLHPMLIRREWRLEEGQRREDSDKVSLTTEDGDKSGMENFFFSHYHAVSDLGGVHTIVWTRFTNRYYVFNHDHPIDPPAFRVLLEFRAADNNNNRPGSINGL
jgi:hypothetical protein